ncbi:VOC family protein [Candidatus Harpocratesius sp.]
MNQNHSFSLNTEADASLYISIEVKNIEKAKKFYTNVFGFSIAWDGGDEIGWCELKLPVKGVRIGLDLKKEGEIIHGSTTLTFNVNNLEATREYLIQKKVRTTEIRDIPKMVSMFDCWDIDGNKILIIGDPRKN